MHAKWRLWRAFPNLSAKQRWDYVCACFEKLGVNDVQEDEEGQEESQDEEGQDAESQDEDGQDEDGQDDDGNEDGNEDDFKNFSNSSEREDPTGGVPINEIDFGVDDDLDNSDSETVDLFVEVLAVAVALPTHPICARC
ncbi:hypothetical protein BJ742DRAFT_778475 [Cladochytrium replicatum]|nr:hypothetical protein BJ742DRAFT_778475 [Cladochytrium replicatum]